MRTLIEEQVLGEQKDFKYSYLAGSSTEAEQVYKTVKEKLLDINNWNNYAGNISAKFYLTDNKGNQIDKQPEIGHYIKIDIPGPGSRTGEGFDWVRIEEFISDIALDEYEIVTAFKVRPSGNPNNKNASTAHFLDNTATSTFMVGKIGLKIYSEIHGRNERPNMLTENIIDKVRNTAVATGAILGIANIQWNLLAKGLLL